MQTAEVPSRVEVVADLLEEIRRGDYGHSGKLPSENDLAARFGVTRNTLREALQDLQAAEVIEPRHRYGWFVRPDQRRDIEHANLAPGGWQSFCEANGLTGRERGHAKGTVWEARDPADGSWATWAIVADAVGRLSHDRVTARPGKPAEVQALALTARSYVIEVERGDSIYVLDVRRFRIVL